MLTKHRNSGMHVSTAKLPFNARGKTHSFIMHIDIQISANYSNTYV